MFSGKLPITREMTEVQKVKITEINMQQEKLMKLHENSTTTTMQQNREVIEAANRHLV